MTTIDTTDTTDTIDTTESTDATEAVDGVAAERDGHRARPDAGPGDVRGAQERFVTSVDLMSEQILRTCYSFVIYSRHGDTLTVDGFCRVNAMDGEQFPL